MTCHGHPRALWALAAAVAISALVVGAAAQQSPADDERFKKLDAGPKVIDVSKYPVEHQKAYKVFSAKCSSCHSIARAVTTDMVLPGEWERYVKRMMFKPNSGISNDEGKSLYRFLVYDAAARKIDVVRKKLKELPADERTAAVEKIKGIDPSFTP